MGSPSEPPGLRREFYDRIEQANRELARVREQVELMRDRVRADRSDGAEELAQFARSAEAPPELRAVQSRIDRGEFTWEQAWTEDVDDEDVRRLRRSARTFFADVAAVFETAEEIARAQGLSSDEAADLAFQELQRRKEADHG